MALAYPASRTLEEAVKRMVGHNAPDAFRASGGWRWSRAAVVLVLIMVTGGLVASSWPAALSWQQRAAAQPQSISIPVYDYTNSWRGDIKIGVERWDAALASRGIRLSYSPQTPTSCESLDQPGSGISVCDATTAAPDERWADGEHQEIWVADGTVYVRGRLRFFKSAPDGDIADMLVCHELGHTLQLMHVPSGSDSCMTQPPELVSPSEWDAAHALSNIPEDETSAIPAEEPQHKNKEWKKEKDKSRKDKKEKEKREKKQPKNDEKQDKKDQERERSGDTTIEPK